MKIISHNGIGMKIIMSANGDLVVSWRDVCVVLNDGDYRGMPYTDGLRHCVVGHCHRLPDLLLATYGAVVGTTPRCSKWRYTVLQDTVLPAPVVGYHRRIGALRSPVPCLFVERLTLRAYMPPGFLTNCRVPWLHHRWRSAKRCASALYHRALSGRAMDDRYHGHCVRTMFSNKPPCSLPP